VTLLWLAGGPVKQSSIFHVTLLRVLEPQPMKREQLEAIHNACQQETERLKGTQFTASSLWYLPHHCSFLVKFRIKFALVYPL
jgi:hypothetical protein